MKSTISGLVMRAGLCFAALSAPSFDVREPMSWTHGAAYAEAAGTSEKEAFEAAKELGTVEAWDAFLSNYPTGFHADLARAYVKKLGEATPAPAAAPAAAYDDFPVVAGSWGGVVRDKPGKQYRQIDSLEEGEEITLMGRSDVMEDGYPWFKIAYRDGKIGFKWGGILCAVGTERSDVYKVCPTPLKRHVEEPRRVEQKREEPKKAVQQGCAKGRVKVDGRCVLKQDAATHCGPGFRLQGNKCVAGYKPPKPQEKLPSWQIEAIKKGCPKGMGWNAQEGCHEND